MTSLPFAAAPDVRATRFTRVDAAVESTLEIQRSVFLTRLVPVAAEDAAREVIETARRAHHGARHHCSAFVLGPDRAVQRSSDDGEPGGTAGVPMMQAILQRETSDGFRDLSDVVAVTTRWFGGILLGAGGLVRAYSESVSAAVDSAQLTTWHRRRRLAVSVPMAEAGRAENALRGLGPAVVDSSYTGEGLTLVLAVDDNSEALARMEAEVAQAMAGKATTAREGAVWAP